MLDLRRKSLSHDGLPLYVLNDLEVSIQVAAAEDHDVKFLTVNQVGALSFGDQFMIVEIRSNGVVFQIRLHWVEGKKHGIHEERFRLYLDTHLLPHVCRVGHGSITLPILSGSLSFNPPVLPEFMNRGLLF
jgi:hypothetical protein